MMNYILCGLAIYGFIGLVLFVVWGCIKGEYLKIVNKELDKNIEPDIECYRNRIEIFVILFTIPIYVMAWPLCYGIRRK